MNFEDETCEACSVIKNWKTVTQGKRDEDTATVHSPGCTNLVERQVYLEAPPQLLVHPLTVLVDHLTEGPIGSVAETQKIYGANLVELNPKINYPKHYL